MIKDTRVLLVSPLPPPIGGIASWTVRYIEWMKSNDYPIALVNNSVIGKRANHYNSKKNLFSELKRTLNMLKEIKKQIKTFKPNIVHINTSCSKLGIIRDYYCARLAKKYENKVVTHYRCNIEDQIEGNRIALMFLKRISNIADINVVLNSPSFNFLKTITKKPIDIMPNFVDESFIFEGEKEIRSKIKKICFTGHIKKSKGVFEIIDVAKEFPQIEFLVAGPVYEKISRTGISENLKFLGALGRVELKKILQNSDVFLFPTYSEGFSNSLLEAMAMGLPIITTPVGANTDMIEEYGGLIIPVGSYLEIKNIIEKIQDVGIRKSMSEWNISKVNNYYTIDIVMKRLLRFYQNLILNNF